MLGNGDDEFDSDGGPCLYVGRPHFRARRDRELVQVQIYLPDDCHASVLESFGSELCIAQHDRKVTSPTAPTQRWCDILSLILSLQMEGKSPPPIFSNPARDSADPSRLLG